MNGGLTQCRDTFMNTACVKHSPAGVSEAIERQSMAYCLIGINCLTTGHGSQTFCQRAVRQRTFRQNRQSGHLANFRPTFLPVN